MRITHFFSIVIICFRCFFKFTIFHRALLCKVWHTTVIQIRPAELIYFLYMNGRTLIESGAHFKIEWKRTWKYEVVETMWRHRHTFISIKCIFCQEGSLQLISMPQLYLSEPPRGTKALATSNLMSLKLCETQKTQNLHNILNNLVCVYDLPCLQIMQARKA